MGGWVLTAASGNVSLAYAHNVSNLGVSGKGTVVYQPGANPNTPYLWTLPWSYSYTAPTSDTDNVTASGTFDGIYLKGTLVKGSCRVDFTNVIVTMMKR
jgi:hypothetical protein